MKYHHFVPDPDTLARRILGEAATLQSATVAGTPGTAVVAAAPVPTSVAALLALRDSAFIDAAYRMIAGRDPDPAGFEYYLSELRSGRRDKLEIIGDLRYSHEGRRQGVPVPGLGLRYRLRRAGRLPLIGWLFRWLRTVLSLNGLDQSARRHQSEFEQIQLVTESHTTAIQQVNDVAQRAHEMLDRERDQLRRDIDIVADRTRASERQVHGLQERVDGLGHSVERAHVDTSQRLSELTHEVATLSAKLSAIEQTFTLRHERLVAANTRLVQQVRGVLAAATASPAAPRAAAAAADRVPDGAVADFDQFYLEFEDRFRGSRERTKEWQEVYLDYVQSAGAGTPSSPVIDLGCGRGEWLELLQEHGCNAVGVDQNAVMLEENRIRGLTVVEADALAYLAGLADDSVGAITGFHIIEHLPFDSLLRILEHCRRVLRPGGCVILETPNPENLVVGAYTFYFDPTHRNPIPPQLAEFVVQQRGFTNVEILRLHPRADEGLDQALLDRWFRTPTDYAVIGWKGEAGPTA